MFVSGWERVLRRGKWKYRDDDDDFDTCFISCLRWRLREERRIYGFIIDLRLI